MNGTMLILLLILVCAGIACTGCILWSDDLEEVCAELGRIIEDTIRKGL